MRPLDLLLAEDYEPDYRWTRRVLEEVCVPHTLSVVREGESALRYLQRRGEFADVGTPDLVLLDLNLPRISGDEVLAEMMQDARLANIPVCVLSGSQLEVKRLTERGLNPRCFLRKPLHYRGLRAALECFAPLHPYVDLLKQPEFDDVFF